MAALGGNGIQTNAEQGFMAVVNFACMRPEAGRQLGNYL